MFFGALLNIHTFSIQRVFPTSLFSLCSLFFGNLYIYFAWHGHVHISGIWQSFLIWNVKNRSGEHVSYYSWISVPLLLGNLILSAWLMFCVPDEDRQTVFISLTVISLVGCFLFFLIRKPEPEAAPSETSEPLLPTEISESNSTTGWVSSRPEEESYSLLEQCRAGRLTFNCKCCPLFSVIQSPRQPNAILERCRCNRWEKKKHKWFEKDEG